MVQRPQCGDASHGSPPQCGAEPPHCGETVVHRAEDALNSIELAWQRAAEGSRQRNASRRPEDLALSFRRCLQEHPELVGMGIFTSWTQKAYPIFCEAEGIERPPPYRVFAYAEGRDAQETQRQAARGQAHDGDLLQDARSCCRGRRSRPREKPAGVIGYRVHTGISCASFAPQGEGVWQLFFHDPNGARVEIETLVGPIDKRCS